MAIPPYMRPPATRLNWIQGVQPSRLLTPAEADGVFDRAAKRAKETRMESSMEELAKQEMARGGNDTTASGRMNRAMAEAAMRGGDPSKALQYLYRGAQAQDAAAVRQQAALARQERLQESGLQKALTAYSRGDKATGDALVKTYGLEGQIPDEVRNNPQSAAAINKAAARVRALGYSTDKTQVQKAFQAAMAGKSDEEIIAAAGAPAQPAGRSGGRGPMVKVQTPNGPVWMRADNAEGQPVAQGSSGGGGRGRSAPSDLDLMRMARTDAARIMKEEDPYGNKYQDPAVAEKRREELVNKFFPQYQAQRQKDIDAGMYRPFNSGQPQGGGAGGGYADTPPGQMPQGYSPPRSGGGSPLVPGDGRGGNVGPKAPPPREPSDDPLGLMPAPAQPRQDPMGLGAQPNTQGGNASPLSVNPNYRMNNPSGGVERHSSYDPTSFDPEFEGEGIDVASYDEESMPGEEGAEQGYDGDEYDVAGDPGYYDDPNGDPAFDEGFDPAFAEDEENFYPTSRTTWG